MLQILYFSTAAVRQDPAVINHILTTSRNNNCRRGITGLLVAGGNRFLHVIEGPRPAVDSLFAVIRADQRHVGVTVLTRRTITRRCFTGSSIAYRPTPDLSEFDSFPDVVRYLIHQVDDPVLRRQIGVLARSFMVEEARLSPQLWSQAC